MRPGLVILAALIAVTAGKAAPAPAFDYDTLSRRAQTMAHQPYQKRSVEIPDWLKKLTYDRCRSSCSFSTQVSSTDRPSS
jgi:glucan biosynthesis protein